jgi:hypothetical protein
VELCADGVELDCQSNRVANDFATFSTQDPVIAKKYGMETEIAGVLMFCD